MQKRKKSGRVAVSVGSARHRTRGDSEGAAGAGGFIVEQPAATMMASTSRQARGIMGGILDDRVGRDMIGCAACLL